MAFLDGLGLRKWGSAKGRLDYYPVTMQQLERAGLTAFSLGVARGRGGGSCNACEAGCCRREATPSQGWQRASRLCTGARASANVERGTIEAKLS